MTVASFDPNAPAVTITSAALKHFESKLVGKRRSCLIVQIALAKTSKRLLDALRDLLAVHVAHLR